MECALDTPKRYSCTICNKQIHSGNENCQCSTYRTEVFAWASLCSECAFAYDRLMSNREVQPILKHLLNKEYWKDRPVIDF